jgi:hypothetical protein
MVYKNDHLFLLRGLVWVAKLGKDAGYGRNANFELGFQGQHFKRQVAYASQCAKLAQASGKDGTPAAEARPRPPRGP